MSRIKGLVPQLLVVLNLAICRMPRIVRLFDLIAQPSVARVIVSHRRQLEYAEFFSPADRDGRRAAPKPRPDGESAERIYRRVEAA